MRICLDLDSTIFDFVPLYRQAFKGTQYQYYHPYRWNVYECYPKSLADVLMRIFTSPAIFHTSLLDNRIPAVVNALVSNFEYDVRVITARNVRRPGEKHKLQTSEEMQEETFKQLQRAKIHLPKEKITVTGHSKLEEFQKQQIDLVFDDSPHIIEECLANDIDSVMISNETTPYNHYLRNRVLWKENLVDAIKQKQL